MLRYFARANTLSSAVTSSISHKISSGISVDKLIHHVRTPLYRNAYALMISTGATSVLGLLYWIIAARYYPPDAVGLNAAVVSMLTFLAGVAQMPSMNAMLRYIPVAGSTTRRLVTWAYLFSMALAAGIGIIFLLSVSFWSPALNFLQQDPWLAVWFLLGVVSWCIFALQDNVLTGLRKAIYVPVENIPYAVGKIVLLILFATTITRYGILASWTFPLIVILIPVNYIIFRKLIPRHMQATKDQKFPFTLSQIVYYVGGNYVGALFLLAATRLLPVLVTNMAGASANAYFYLPWTIATSLKLIIANMTTSFTVEVVADNSKLRAYSYRFLVHTTGVLVLPVLLLLVSAPYVLTFSGKAYAAEGTQLLRLLALAALPNILTSLYLGIARVKQRVSGIIALQVALCVLTLGLSSLFLQRYGITGVGIAILVSEVIVALGVLVTGLRSILLKPLWLKLVGPSTPPLSGGQD
jgi:O-antigen/teichoic acid export membrane protein